MMKVGPFQCVIRRQREEIARAEDFVTITATATTTVTAAPTIPSASKRVTVTSINGVVVVISR